MDLFELFWECRQQAEIDDLKTSNADIEHRTFTGIQKIQQDSRELSIRINALMRLLVENGLLTADQIQAAISNERARQSETRKKDQEVKIPTKEQIAESKRLFELKYKKKT